MRDKFVNFIFELLLFVVFLLCALFIVMIGARVLENTQKRSDTDFYNTLSLQYINNKIHQKDKEDLVGLAEVDGVTVLELKNKDSDYVTWIYYQDGALYELLTDPADGLKLSDGIKVMDCAEIEFEETKDDSGTKRQIVLSNNTNKLKVHLNHMFYEIN